MSEAASELHFMTNDGDALFRVICEQPWEDTPRLMYADWLEEHGDAERAEFIRLQCEASAIDPSYLDELSRTRLTWLLVGSGSKWRAELPVLPGVRWNMLFVRGFIEYADVFARYDLAEILPRVFAAAPLVRLVVHELDEPRLLTLLNFPFLSRLTTLAMPDLRTPQLSKDAKAKLLEVAEQFENTRLLYNRV